MLRRLPSRCAWTLTAMAVWAVAAIICATAALASSGAQAPMSSPGFQAQVVMNTGHIRTEHHAGHDVCALPLPVFGSPADDMHARYPAQVPADDSALHPRSGRDAFRKIPGLLAVRSQAALTRMPVAPEGIMAGGVTGPRRKFSIVCTKVEAAAIGWNTACGREKNSRFNFNASLSYISGMPSTGSWASGITHPAHRDISPTTGKLADFGALSVSSPMIACAVPARPESATPRTECGTARWTASALPAGPRIPMDLCT